MQRDDVTVDEREWLSERFDEHRPHLRGIAYRMLGSLTEADDAVQEAWLRLSSAHTDEIHNLGGWLTTVVGRVCLNMLQSRRSRREQPLEAHAWERTVGSEDGVDPEQEALLADSVGVALLVVLDTLNPAERLAFVLHDMFAVPFDEIAPIVGRSTAAARQLASRARRRIHGAPAVHDVEFARQREVVEAFFAATRDGDFEALLTLLDPEIVCRIDGAGLPMGAPIVLRGASNVAKRGLAAPGGRRYSQLALVDGAVGIVVAPYGRLLAVLSFTVSGAKIVEMDVISDETRVRGLDLAVLDR
jgi:RNA polymerase sigma-70 factor (ECF subfamily)